MSINCIVVDDEKPAIEIMEHHIKRVDYLNLVGKAKSVLEATKLLTECNVDLIFLDIRMPEISGLEFLTTLQGRDKYKVIITSAYREHALEGFALNVTDYLLKPISFARFLQAVQKVQEKALVNTQGSDDFIYVQVNQKGSFQKINLMDISYIESSGNNLIINHLNESSIVAMTLSKIEGMLPKFFCRVHKSFIVSEYHIKSVIANNIILSDHKEKIPIGTIYKEGFLNIIKKRIRG